VLMAVQPVQQEYEFDGFIAPIVQFQQPGQIQNGTVELSQPQVYSLIDFTQPNDMLYRWEGQFTAERDGQLNALRFITKNILAVVPERNSTIDWLNHYMTLPLAEPIQLRAGETVQVGFAYRAGAQIQSLQATMRAVALREATTSPAVAAFAA